MPLHLQWCNKRKIGRFLYTVKAHKSRQDTVELSLPPIEILVFRLDPLNLESLLRSEKLRFFNHRAKRGGSLFEGSSGKEEGSRSDPLCWGVRLRSPVFTEQVPLNLVGIG